MAEGSSQAKRWQKVESLFRSVVDLSTSERRDFLDAACVGDEALRLEVEELLSSDAKVSEEDFIASAVRAGEDLLTSGEGEILPPGFGKYQVEARLGEGGFGVVYKGRDPQLARPVAIKACSSFDDSLRKRFYREARIAAGLRHPNITTVHELGVDDGIPFLVQEFLDGEDLRQIIADRRSLPLATAVDYLAQIARGLDHAHQAGVLHRDVKPANVRVLPDGTVKLMDFGIAKLMGADTGLTGTGTTLGTVGYLAPEQLRSEEVDERVDIFAFGVVAYELLSGSRPFRGEDFSQVSYQLLYVDPPRLSDLWPGCPTALVDLVHGCLEKERSARPGSCRQLVDALSGLAEALRSSSLGATGRPSSGEILPAEQTLRSNLPEPTVARPGQTHSPPGRFKGRWMALATAALVLSGGSWLGSRWLVADRRLDGPPLAQGVAPRPGEAVSERHSSGSGEEPEVRQEEPIADGIPSRAGSPLPILPSSDPLPRVAAPSGIRSFSEPVAAPENRQPTPRVSPPEPSQGIVRAEAEKPPSAVGPAVLHTNGEPSPPAAGSPGTEDARSPQADLVRAEVPPVAEDPSDRAADRENNGPPRIPEEFSMFPAPEVVRTDMQPGDLITDEGAGVVPPRLLDQPRPEYPARALRRRIEGRVMVKVLVDETGRVLQAIAPGEDEHGFLAAARQAARGARFEAPSRDGVRGRMWINLPFDFTLE